MLVYQHYLILRPQPNYISCPNLITARNWVHSFHISFGPFSPGVPNLMTLWGDEVLYNGAWPHLQLLWDGHSLWDVGWTHTCWSKQLLHLSSLSGPWHFWIQQVCYFVGYPSAYSCLCAPSIRLRHGLEAALFFRAPGGLLAACSWWSHWFCFFKWLGTVPCPSAGAHYTSHQNLHDFLFYAPDYVIYIHHYLGSHTLSAVTSPFKDFVYIIIILGTSLQPRNTNVLQASLYFPFIVGRKHSSITLVPSSAGYIGTKFQKLDVI